jgi:hypothetical protein
MATIPIDQSDLPKFIRDVLEQIGRGVNQTVKAGIMCYLPDTVDFDLSISSEGGPVGQVKFTIPLMLELHRRMKERCREGPLE